MKNNKKGFTLVELVIVVAVMAILVAVAIPTVGSITGTAKTAVNDSNAQTIESMLKLAEAEGARTAADGNGTVNPKAIAKVLVEAKLGIEEGKFVYNVASGTVKYNSAATTGTETDLLITFAKAAGTGTTATKASVTVSDGSENPPCYNLDGSTQNMGK